MPKASKGAKPVAKLSAPAKSKPPQKARRRAETPVMDDDKDNGSQETTAPASKRLLVKWDDARTNRLLDWLDQHPDDCN
jgi:hypothetical protein